MNSHPSLFLRADQAERRLCLLANAAARRRYIRSLFRAVSRLGDGVFWYSLMVALPLFQGMAGLATMLRMAVVGALGLAIYRLLKHRLVRERPYIGLIGIDCAMPPLDRYSFPSGHTLHAVAFTTVAVSAFPVLAAVLVPFAILVAASRVILGLHYPTDVAAGALLGYGLAELVLMLA
jgi:undecaprenyl-diphosphatase